MYRAIVLFVVTIFSTISAGQNQHFVDLAEYFKGDNQLSRLMAYQSLLGVLQKDFDYICPDTFCEGRYKNLRVLDIACSVESTQGKLKMCAWTIAGSNFSLHEFGEFAATSDVFTCNSFMAGTNANDFVDYLGQFKERAMFEKVVGGKSLYQLLSECL